MPKRLTMATALALAVLVGAAHAQAPTVTVPPSAGKPFIIPLGGYDLAKLGYTTEEFFVSGSATAYGLSGSPPADGRWKVKAETAAPYVTRILVARPDPARFNGTVVVEWLNVTAGTDTPVDWWTLHRELIRKGYAWVGVTAQSVGVEGGVAAAGPSAAPPLKKINPARYSGLRHPGDAYSYDIYSQIGRMLRGPDAGRVLGGLAPKRIIAVGESQSAFYLTTYVDAIAPLAKAYDGYLIHSRFGLGARLDGKGLAAGLETFPQDVRIRTDLGVPVIVVQTETDVRGNPAPGRKEGWFMSGTERARQPDTNRLRVWELPGTAHADNYLSKVAGSDSGSLAPQAWAAGLAPAMDVGGQKLVKPMNFNPAVHYVVEAALRDLDQWITTGKAPPKAKPIEMATGSAGAPAAPVLDPHGNALGGIRTPWIDVPTARLAGGGNAAVDGVNVLFGLGEPLDKQTLDKLYPGGKAEYLTRFQAALDGTITAGFILPDDRQEILDVASATYDQTP